jgi:hypothetical protein
VQGKPHQTLNPAATTASAARSALGGRRTAAWHGQHPLPHAMQAMRHMELVPDCGSGWQDIYCCETPITFSLFIEGCSAWTVGGKKTKDEALSKYSCRNPVQDVADSLW